MHGDFTPFISKSFQMWDHFFPIEKDVKGRCFENGIFIYSYWHAKLSEDKN